MPAELVPGNDVPRALLWDFDGTLVDSERSWHAAERRMMSDWGATITPEQQFSLIGMSLDASAAQLMEWAGVRDLDPGDQASVMIDHAMADMAANGAEPRPGASELMEQARRAGVRQALVSASHRRVLEAVLDKMPGHGFELIVAGDDVTRGKPDPEPYRSAVERLGLEPRDCLALEDSLPGTASAEAAGVATLGVRFVQEIVDGPRRRIVPTLAGLDLAEVGRHWRELRDA